MNYLKADGFDAAIIGIDPHSERVVYDIYKMIEICENWDMDEEVAIEYLEYNVFPAYVGPHTPIYIYPMDCEELERSIDYFPQ